MGIPFIKSNNMQCWGVAGHFEICGGWPVLKTCFDERALTSPSAEYCHLLLSHLSYCDIPVIKTHANWHLCTVAHVCDYCGGIVLRVCLFLVLLVSYMLGYGSARLSVLPSFCRGNNFCYAFCT